jgi:hypothetical protein
LEGLLAVDLRAERFHRFTDAPGRFIGGEPTSAEGYFAS